MFLLCGLGNPEDKYVNTRHNVGFKFIDKLIEKLNFETLKKDKKKQIFKGHIGKHNCLLIKPLTYMNLSGLAVQEVLNFYKIKKSNLFVIHDDLDLEIAKVKIKLGGGDGGHNGISSIDETIGKNYNRIRIGINHPGSKELVSKYVLSKFSKKEIDVIESKLDKITEFIELIFEDTSLFLTRIAADKKNGI